MADERELQDLVVAFVRAFGLHRPDTTPCGRPLPVSEAHALMELAHDGLLSQSDLVTRLELDKSTVSRLVANLERDALVRRARDGRDGRVRRLELTHAGRGVAAELARARRRRFGEILAALSPEDREAVVRGLAALVRATKEAGE